jgi:hypothetical protein
VDADGRRTPVTWTRGAEGACAADPFAAGCEVDVATATGRLRDRPLREGPAASSFPVSVTGEVRWARSVDSRTLHWSTDGGTTWQSHTTSLPASEDVQATAAGSWAVFFAYPDAEFTRDGGDTWERWDGAAPLASYVVANELVVVSADGDLVLVSHRAAKRPEVLASTDDTWREFGRSDVATRFGTVSPQAAGPWLWVPDQGRVWVSPNGRSWKVVAPPRR